MDNEYHVRVDTDLSESIILSFFNDDRVAKFIVSSEHKNDGTRHIHAYVFLNLKLTTFRSQLISFFKLGKKKGKYSVSRKRKQTLGEYVVKEGEILGYGGFTKEEVDKWIEGSYSKEKKTFRNGSVMSQLVPEFMKTYNGGELEPRVVLKFIYQYYLHQMKIFPSDFKMKDMMWTLMAQVIYQEAKTKNLQYTRLEKLIDYKCDVVMGQEFIKEF